VRTCVSVLVCACVYMCVCVCMCVLCVCMCVFAKYVFTVGTATVGTAWSFA